MSSIYWFLLSIGSPVAVPAVAATAAVAGPAGAAEPAAEPAEIGSPSVQRRSGGDEKTTAWHHTKSRREQKRGEERTRTTNKKHQSLFMLQDATRVLPPRCETKTRSYNSLCRQESVRRQAWY